MQVSKRAELIEKATRLFYQKGLHAVGINEVIRFSGVAKKTLYNHFETKEALILACLEYRHKNFMQWMITCLNHEQSGKAKIGYFFTQLDRWFNGDIPKLGDFRGCFFINACAEYSPRNNEITELCQAHKNTVRQAFVNALDENMPTEQRESLGHTLFILMEGCISEALIAGNSRSSIGISSTLEQLIPG